MIELDDIRRAAGAIAQAANRTPVMRSRTLDRLSAAKVYLKCENFQRTGSFKFRGAYNAISLLDNEQRSAGVVTHSSGNHAQALALAAAAAGVRARIVMPSGSVAIKIDAVKGYGADVILCGNTLESRETTAAALIESQGLSLVHPYDNERVRAGAAVAGRVVVSARATVWGAAGKRAAAMRFAGAVFATVEALAAGIGFFTVTIGARSFFTKSVTALEVVSRPTLS